MKSKKIFQNILIFAMIMALFTGCTVNNTDTNVETEVSNVPAVIAKTNGGEKWETKIDYANADIIEDFGCIVSINSDRIIKFNAV